MVKDQAVDGPQSTSAQGRKVTILDAPVSDKADSVADKAQAARTSSSLSQGEETRQSEAAEECLDDEDEIEDEMDAKINPEGERPVGVQVVREVIIDHSSPPGHDEQRDFDKYGLPRDARAGAPPNLDKIKLGTWEQPSALGEIRIETNTPVLDHPIPGPTKSPSHESK